ncbi:MAG TPA: LuxR C-terminal-related transcriptional regulator [Polyangiaceae bacterium]|nr:LuxR C-terminal-related transcriptional regulator [Polyangiaceae bacterium]
MSFSITPEGVREVTRAAYSFSAELGHWAARVHDALGPSLDRGQGTLVSIVEFPERGVRIRYLASRAGASRVHHAIVRLSAFLAPDTLRRSFFNGRILGSSSGHYSDADFARMQARARGGRSRDAAGWCVNDAVDHGLMIVAPARELLRFPDQPSPLLKRLAAHVATGLRLQRVLGSAELDDPSVEAILDHEGQPRHAAGMARMNGALDQLRAAVLARARTPVAELAVDPAWEAVLSGRWSLVDRFDSDGRRYVVAYRNPPGVLDPRRLTPREEGVTALAAVGRANKEIASQLGVTSSTVGTLLASALVKLGLPSRTMLPVFWRDMHGRAWAVSDREAPLIALSHQEQEPDGIRGLTPTERAVALALLEGMSDRRIALARNSSRHTISKHVSAIYRKLGVNSRVELAYKLALARGALGEARPAGGAPAAPGPRDAE